VLRLALYVLGVFALLMVLRQVPVLGPVFGIPILGFFLAAAILSALVGWWTARAVETRGLRRAARELGATDTPRNQGKLGALYVARRRYRAALAPLERAAAGEPQHAEWQHRLGQARLATGDARGAVVALERAVEIDPAHAYGAPWLRLAEARLALSEAREALAAVEHFERERGPTAESAWWRGLALRAAGEKALAREAFGSVGRRAEEALRGARAGLVVLRVKAWVMGRV
jgi:tetratricopeptide (TPR) repeat protein